MGIAEQMGRVLQRTSISVNIKERLDFSCALFDSQGAPLHLRARPPPLRSLLAPCRHRMGASHCAAHGCRPSSALNAFLPPVTQATWCPTRRTCPSTWAP